MPQTKVMKLDEASEASQLSERIRQKKEQCFAIQKSYIALDETGLKRLGHKTLQDALVHIHTTISKEIETSIRKHEKKYPN